MRAIVTGTRGFVGSHLVRALRSNAIFDHVVGLHRGKGYSITTETAPSGKEVVYEEVGGVDLTKEGWVSGILDSVRPDYIFHFAANPNTKLSRDDPNGTTLFYNNVHSTFNLLTHAPEGCRFVFASSATVYGDGPGPWNESDRTWPTSIYGASKLASESLCLAHKDKIRPLILRFPAVVGPDARHGLLPDVVRKVLEDSPEIELYGLFPGSTKPYVHVEDAVTVAVWLALHAQTNLVNVAPADSASVEEIAVRIMRLTRKYKNIKWNKEAVWAGDNPYVRVSNDYMRSFGLFLKYPYSLEAVEAAAKQMLAIRRVAT